MFEPDRRPSDSKGALEIQIAERNLMHYEPQYHHHSRQAIAAAVIVHVLPAPTTCANSGLPP